MAGPNNNNQVKSQRSAKEPALDLVRWERALSRQLERLQSKIPPPKAFPRPDAERLQLIWKLWHLLPQNWSADSRIALLSIPAKRILGQRKRYDAMKREFARRAVANQPSVPSTAFWKEFGGHFTASDAGTFEAARWWDRFLNDCRRVLTRIDQVREQANFRDYLMHAAADVATHRTARELEIAYPAFWKNQSPTLDLVQQARERWQAYLEARNKAVAEFGQLVSTQPVFKQTLANRRDRQKRLAWLADPQKLADYLSGDFWRASLSERERFITEDLHRESMLQQHYELFADYMACNNVASDVLRNFMAKDFIVLTKDEQLRFVQLCAQRRRDLKKTRYTILKTWLRDNTPVFQQFQWRMNAVIKAVADRFPDYPGHAADDEEGVFKRALSEWGIVLGLPPGRKRVGQIFHEPHKELLTEPPELPLQNSPPRNTTVRKSVRPKAPKP